MMTAGDKECELPAADSCAIMEGEDAEDDLIYLTKKSFFTKIKSFSREVRPKRHESSLYRELDTISVSLYVVCIHILHCKDIFVIKFLTCVCNTVTQNSKRRFPLKLQWKVVHKIVTILSMNVLITLK